MRPPARRSCVNGEHAMHIKTTTLITLLLCACAWSVSAQAPAAVAAAAPSLGTIDFGFRAGAVDGDVARYERFRDLRNGAFSRIRFGKDTGTYTFSVGADNIGYRD